MKALALCVLVLGSATATAHAQSNGGGSRPPTASDRRVGEAALAAAAEGRCDAALSLWASISRVHRDYRHDLAIDPALAACQHAATAAAAPARPATPAPTLQPGDKDPRHARNLSLEATAGAWGALVVGAAITAGPAWRSPMIAVAGKALLVGGGAATLVTPLLGHWYAGEHWSRGMTMRTVGAAAAGVAALAYGVHSIGCDGDPSCASPGGTVAVVGLVSVGLYIAGTIDDLRTAGRAARRHNGREPRWQIRPSAMAAPKGTVPGLAVAGSF